MMNAAEPGTKTHPNNPLNDLDASGWAQLSRSWFIGDAGGEKEWRSLKEQHPATYPKVVPARLIETYSKRGETILDPMCGSGTTLIAAAQLSRYSIGIDLYQKNIDLSRDCLNRYFHHNQQSLFDDDETKALWKPHLIQADAIAAVKKFIPPGSIDYTLFSPPYSNALHTKGSGVLTRHKERKERGLATTYGDDGRDLGNAKDDLTFFGLMLQLADAIYAATKPGRYMSLVMQNYVGLEFRPMAWELALAIADRTDWVMKPEQIWVQQQKQLRIHGWPKTFLTSNHHHYVLNFQKTPGETNSDEFEENEFDRIQDTQPLFDF